MNNLFLEGPIQVGKSTLIREALQSACGDRNSGINCREVDRNSGGNCCGGDSCDSRSSWDKCVGGFSVQRISFPTPGDDTRIGFRLMPAFSPIHAHTCVTATDEMILASPGVFKLVGGEHGSAVDLSVFEDMGVQLLKQSINDAKAGRIKLVLLDEIGGHELVCDEFREILYQLLESDIPCIGVIKLNENSKRMARKNPKIAELNEELHKKITGSSGEHGEILYCKTPDESIRRNVIQFIKNSCCTE